MAAYEHLVKSYNVRDLLDEIASADPPAYLRRCFAEGCSAPLLSWNRVHYAGAWTPPRNWNNSPAPWLLLE